MMRRSATFVVLLTLGACSQKDSKPAPAPEDKPPTRTVGSAGSAAASETPPPAPPPPSETDAAAEVADLVVHDVGSKALGSQKIEASCVSVVVMPGGKWTIAAARLNGCGDKTARSILWLYKRPETGGKWNEDYLGQPPKCWKGVPADILEAVTKSTKIPSC
ncbi:MAG TPA: hypothetical protein VMZ53_03100 [Kofleriaceae bacterium]|nr:hypothetical protein [Kofleriaceae bacterium]